MRSTGRHSSFPSVVTNSDALKLSTTPLVKRVPLLFVITLPKLLRFISCNFKHRSTVAKVIVKMKMTPSFDDMVYAVLRSSCNDIERPITRVSRSHYGNLC